VSRASLFYLVEGVVHSEADEAGPELACVEHVELELSDDAA